MDLSSYAGWFSIGGGVLAACAAGLLAWALLADRSRGRRRCPRCWYDRAGVQSLTCPECGHTAKSERSLLRTRRKWRTAVVALGLLALSGGIARTPRIVREGVCGVIPDRPLCWVFSLYPDAAEAAFHKARTAPTLNSLTPLERMQASWYAASRMLDDEVPADDYALRPTMTLFLFGNPGEHLRPVYPILADRLLDDSNAAPRQSEVLLETLASRGDERALELAQNALSRADSPGTRATGAWSLRFAAPDKSRFIRALSWAVEHDRDDSVRLTALNAIIVIRRGASAINPYFLVPAPPIATGPAPPLQECVGDAFRAAIRDRYPSTRSLATQYMGVFEIADSDLPVLAAMLREDPSEHVRRNIAKYVDEAKKTEPIWLEPLVSLLDDANEDVRLQACMALEHFGRAAEHAAPTLKRRFLEQRENVSRAWLTTLAAVHPDARSTLTEMLRASSPTAGRVVLWELFARNWLGPEHAPLLLDHLRDRSAPVRVQAAGFLAVAGRGNQNVVQALSSAAITDPDANVRAECMRSLHRLAPEDPASIGVFALGLKDKHRAVVVEAAMGLATIQSPPSLRADAQSLLETLLHHDDVRVRSIAWGALGLKDVWPAVDNSVNEADPADPE